MILPNNDHLEGDTKESQETQRIWLTSEFSKTEQDTVKVKQAMANTYCPQRLKINNVGKEHVTVKQILDQWPYPQRSEYLQSYFTSLMGFNLVDKLDQEFVSEAKDIIIYTLSKGSALRKSERARECCFKVAP